MPHDAPSPALPQPRHPPSFLGVDASLAVTAGVRLSRVSPPTLMVPDGAAGRSVKPLQSQLAQETHHTPLPVRLRFRRKALVPIRLHFGL